ncbi:aldose 1-epimerase [Mesorhizobium muleiense]|uniref:aldose 1-epimerase n=1 Tax=Mesorhizobium muleiense TaxID=1004279 RepID=UPI001F3E762D|nr:aldose 1-epimerase [Mesorhizobium muleiense]MCF6112152.1 aldose 1-epimerase [Mesorhizobium muleiense]
MVDVTIASDAVECVVNTTGGAIWRLDARFDDGTKVPLLRPPPAGEHRDVLKSGCFPLIPFGNRVAGNCFSFADTEHHLEPNISWDPHYLHGDGWLGEWKLLLHATESVELGFEFDGAPYRYAARQLFSATGRQLEISMTVENRAQQPLPFGMGWHPFFPLTPATTLHATASRYWTERAGWLPDTLVDIPDDLDFSTPGRPPRRWVNNGFEGWHGDAKIAWPEGDLSLSISTHPPLRRYFLFLSDTKFDPSYAGDFFCFEPMSHSPNGHNLANLGGLSILAPGESRSTMMRLTWRHVRGDRQP